MHDRLQAILDAKDEDVRALKSRGLPRKSGQGARRDFTAALSRPGTGVIAEIKRRSPTRPALRPGADAAAVARAYERAGAVALSVLTDQRFFGGSLDDLAAARAATGLPVLRKDFVIDPLQREETRASGADAVLLIAAALDERLAPMLRRCEALELEALVEVHDATELRGALDAGARVVGVNNRDLRDFAVDLGTCERLRPSIPPDRIAVAESGIATPADLRRVAAAGYDACLVGGALMEARDPGDALAALTSARETEAAR